MSSATRPITVTVLASGQGTNLQALLDAIHRGDLPVRIGSVISDRANAGALDRARAAGVRAVHLSARRFADRLSYDQALAAHIEADDAQLVVLAGFMRILHADMVNRFRGRMLNIHPALLPSYRGLDTHRRVLAAGDALHGATVHFVTPELDAGPAVLQYRLAVHPWDTVATLADRVHQGEHRIYPTAVRWFAEGRLRCTAHDVRLDEQILRAPLVLTRDGWEPPVLFD